jgi:hypothetical protein
MVDRSAFEAMESALDEIGSAIAVSADDYLETALKAYEYIAAPDGHIEFLGGMSPELYGESDDSLAAWNDDNHVCSYGVDASTTQERDFSNGLRLCLANAKAGVIGPGANRLEDENHVIIGLYDRDGHTGLSSKPLRDDSTVRADLRVFDESVPYRTRRLVKSLTRTLAEGEHLIHVLDTMHADAEPGPVFIDGPIYPPMILPEVVSRHIEGKENAWTDIFGESVGNYLDVASWALDTGWPVIGIVKDMDSSSLVTDLKSKVGQYGLHDDIEFPWKTDKQFLTDLLQEDGPGTFVYTDWMVQVEQYTTASVDGDSYVNPFTDCPHLKFDADEYLRAFFFVKNPHTNTILRVETPRGLVRDDTSREYIQRRALAEIAKNGETAEAIVRADSQARISRQAQHQLFSRLYTNLNAVTSYNRDYRGPEYTGDEH